MKGKGTAHVDGRSYPIEVDSNLEKITLNTGKEFYFGPAEAKIKLGQNTSDCLVGIEYDVQADKLFASLTVGAISDDGSALLYFGNPLEETREILDLKKEQANLDKKPITQTSAGTNNQLVSPEGATDYTYKTSANSYNMRWQNNSSSSSTGYSVVGLNVYTRDPDVNGNGSGSVYARAWSNSQAVIDYTKSIDGGASPNTTAYVDRAYISFQTYDSTGYLNIWNSGPADSKQITAYSWLSYIPVYGKQVSMVANGLVALYNASATVTSTPLRDNVWNRVYYLRKNIGTIGKSADYTSKWNTAGGVIDTPDGGVQASFDYSEYTGGRRLCRLLLASTTLSMTVGIIGVGSTPMQLLQLGMLIC